jgi:hypothetical protein
MKTTNIEKLMVGKELPPAEVLEELLSYDKHSGSLIWRSRKGDTQPIKTWNTRFSGKEFGHVHRSGYRMGMINYVHYLAHRIVWKMAHGEDPQVIDHINGDKLDNRICNLRSGTYQDNMRNQKLRKSNNSGVTGVSWHKSHKKWRACIGSHGTRVDLGCFDEFEEAVFARKQAEIKLNYHNNHGRRT